jgi:hypothetical protein
MMRRKTALFSAVIAVIALAGCETAPPRYVPIPTSEPFCKAVIPTCISKTDVLSEGTAQQIEANNRGTTSVCPRAPKCQPAKPAP